MEDIQDILWKDSDEEIWRDITGFPLYQISNQGRVRSFNGRRPVILKATASNKQHHRKVTLYANQYGIRTKFNIHISTLVKTYF